MLNMPWKGKREAERVREGMRDIKRDRKCDEDKYER